MVRIWKNDMWSRQCLYLSNIDAIDRESTSERWKRDSTVTKKEGF